MADSNSTIANFKRSAQGIEPATGMRTVVFWSRKTGLFIAEPLTVALAIWPSHSSQSPAPASPFMKSRPWTWKFGESMVCWVMWICEPLFRTLQTTADHFVLNPTCSESSPNLGLDQNIIKWGRESCDIYIHRSNCLDS